MHNSHYKIIFQNSICSFVIKRIDNWKDSLLTALWSLAVTSSTFWNLKKCNVVYLETLGRMSNMISDHDWKTDRGWPQERTTEFPLRSSWAGTGWEMHRRHFCNIYMETSIYCPDQQHILTWRGWSLVFRSSCLVLHFHQRRRFEIVRRMLLG